MRHFILPTLFLSCAAQFVAPQAVADEACNWTGTWSSTYGDLRLLQEGDTVKGDYSHIGIIEGMVDENCGLAGKFTNFRQARDGTYSFKKNGKRFNGNWRWESASGDGKWGGTLRSTDIPVIENERLAETACDWTGTWSSTLGDLKLVHSGTSVSGTQRNDGQLSGSTEECRLQGSIENADEGRGRDFSIVKSHRRFEGTWSWQDGSSYQTYVWGGTLRSDNIPVIPQPDKPIQPVPEAPDEVVDDPKKNMTQTWRVNLGMVCATRVETYNEPQSIFGIAWIKARITHKKTKEQIAVAPVGGFPNLYNDKERVFEVQEDAKTGGNKAAVELMECASFSKKGFIKHEFSNALHNGADPISLEYKIDAARFGYDDMDDLLSNRDNRIRVMVKLSEWDLISPNEELGTIARNTPMVEANFCGSCQIKDRTMRNAFGEDYSRSYLTGFPIGDGVLSGFKNSGEEALVLYDIIPVD